MKSAAAIAFDYRPSRLLAAAIVVVLALALLAVWLSGLDPVLKLLAAAAAVAHAAASLRRFLQGNTVRRAAWQEAGHWRVVDRDGEERVADLSGATVRAGWIVLNLRGAGAARITLVLAPDNSAAELRRRLRVRLARGTADPASSM